MSSCHCAHKAAHGKTRTYLRSKVNASAITFNSRHSRSNSTRHQFHKPPKISTRNNFLEIKKPSILFEKQLGLPQVGYTMTAITSSPLRLCIVYSCCVLVLVMASTPETAFARELSQHNDGGQCNQPSRCAEYCQGFGLRYGGFLGAAHCRLSNSGSRETSCVNGVSQCKQATQDTYFSASGCFCCCVDVAGNPSDKRDLGAVSAGMSDCESFCSGFHEGFVANLCYANERHDGGGKRYCAVNSLGTAIGCAHTSTARAGDVDRNCCCNLPVP